VNSDDDTFNVNGEIAGSSSTTITTTSRNLANDKSNNQALHAEAFIVTYYKL